MICAEAIVMSTLLAVQSFWTDGAGRRVVVMEKSLWVEVRPNLYAPRATAAAFDRKLEDPAICRAFRTLDTAIKAEQPEPARLWCLEWQATPDTPPRLACKSP